MVVKERGVLQFVPEKTMQISQKYQCKCAIAVEKGQGGDRLMTQERMLGICTHTRCADLTALTLNLRQCLHSFSGRISLAGLLALKFSHLYRMDHEMCLLALLAGYRPLLH